MSGDLESFVNRPVSVITADGRIFIGNKQIVYFLQIKIFYRLVTDTCLFILEDTFQQSVFTLSYLINTTKYVRKVMASK